MMNYYNQLKNWYESRQLRDRVLFICLTWFLIIILFTLLLIKPLIHRMQTMRVTLNNIEKQVNTITIQIDAVSKLSNTPLYKQWLKEQHAFTNVQGQYQSTLQTFASKKWQDVVRFILQPQSNINLTEIKNYPETAYNSSATTTNNQTSIYQQRLAISGYTTYFMAIKYLQNLERQLPTIHWNSLHYQVTQYPTAQIEMEFSVFYDKNK